MSESTAFYALLVPTAVVAGLIRGFAGFGGPLVMLPALTLFLAPAVAIPVMMWIDLLVNVRLVPEVARQASAAVVVPLAIGSLVAMPLGVLALVSVDPALMKRGISATILVAALVLLSGWRYRGDIDRRGYAAIGALAGLVMGATSIAVTAALFLQAGSQSAAQNRANFIVWVFLATLAMLALLAAGTGVGVSQVSLIAVLAPLYVIGSIAGSKLNDRLPEAAVRRGVLLLVVAVCLASLLA